MADTTIVNTPAQATDESGAAGWAVALIVILAVIVGGFLFYRYYGASYATPASPSSTNINVTIPAPAAAPAPATGGTNGGTNY